MADVSNLLESMDDAERIAVAVVRMVKAGKFSFSAAPLVFSILRDAADLAQGIMATVPEITDLDAQESGQLTARGYQLVQSIIREVKAPAALAAK